MNGLSWVNCWNLPADLLKIDLTQLAVMLGSTLGDVWLF